MSLYRNARKLLYLFANRALFIFLIIWTKDYHFVVWEHLLAHVSMACDDARFARYIATQANDLATLG